jgi:hypothetical protein
MAKAKTSNWDDIKLPMLEDSASIQVATSQIVAALLSSRLDARRTGLLLYALQIASQNIDRASSREDSETVHSMTVTGEGDELAPEKEICEPADCASCNRRDTCEDYDPEEEDEEPAPQGRWPTLDPPIKNGRPVILSEAQRGPQRQVFVAGVGERSRRTRISWRKGGRPPGFATPTVRLPFPNHQGRCCAPW